MNRVNHPDAFIQHVLIIETKHSETLSLKPIVPNRVVVLELPQVMAPSIQFDDQLPLKADEVHDEPAYWLLSAKLEAELATAEISPDHRFGKSGFGAVLTGIRE